MSRRTQLKRGHKNLAIWPVLYLPILFLLLGGTNSVGNSSHLQKQKADSSENEGEQLRHSLCYSFLKQGNLFMRCNGTLQELTTEGNADDFAVSQTGSAIVVIQQEGTKNLAHGFGTLTRVMQVIPLKEGAQERLVPIGKQGGVLAATCGSVLYVYREPNDVLRGNDLQFKPYNPFRCSTDRTTIAGEVSIDSQGAVVIGLPPADSQSAFVSGFPPNLKEPWVANSDFEGFAYDVSPSGKYFAYFQDPKELCLVDSQTTKSCVSQVDAVIDALDSVSVSDSGDVLFTTETSTNCYYRDPFHISSVPLPGYDEQDRCAAIAVLQKGKHSFGIVETLARRPQWLTPEAASAITSWRDRRNVLGRR